MQGAASRTLLAEGFVALPRLLDAGEVALATQALEDVFAAQADIAEARQWTTPTYRVAYALPNRHAAFLDLVGHEPLVALAREVLGEDLVLSAFNGIDLPPGGTPQALHRDHPQAAPGELLTVQVVVALDPFRTETGATLVVPQSHRAPLADAPIEDLAHRAHSVEVPPGGGVAYDGALVHAGGVNRSMHPRRALHVFYARRGVVPHWDLAAGLGEAARAALRPSQRALLAARGGLRRYDPSTRSVVR